MTTREWESADLIMRGMYLRAKIGIQFAAEWLESRTIQNELVISKTNG